MANIDDDEDEEDKDQESEEMDPPKRKMIATLKVKVAFSVQILSFSGSKSHIESAATGAFLLFTLINPVFNSSKQ